MDNSTLFDLPPLPDYTLYPRPPLINGIPDPYLTTIALVVIYWVWSLFFHLIDEFDLFPQYRLHTPAEVLKRNHVTRWEVVRDVLIQQAIQAFFGISLTFIEDPEMAGKENYDIAVWAQRLRIGQRTLPTLLGMVGLDTASLAKNLGSQHAMLAGALSGGVYPGLTQTISLAGERITAPAFAPWEMLVARAIYYVVYPALQFAVAIAIVDTWQYFLHRAMHMNKWLYTTFHARHHRLYVPYAYGALYNHPFEGFLLDTLGSGVGYLVSGMTPRQGLCFFGLSTIKTVDDHCGYSFPWDPLQLFTNNNAGYHDVHHQSWGIKTNFSQPYFTFWDELLGTKWTGGDVSARYERARIAAQRKVDAEVRPITGSDSNESIQSSAAPYGSEASKASSAARTAQSAVEPRIPAGKATQQAIGSRQQILDDTQGGGISVLAEETAEEVNYQQSKTPRRSVRHRSTNSGLKGLADKMGDALHGKSSGVLGVENR